MEANTFLGVSFFVWAGLCLAVAGTYLIIWPKPPKKSTHERTRGTHLVLRYFHALVWFLLAAACFLWGVGNPLATVLALLALVVYALFMVTFLRDRSAQRAARPLTDGADDAAEQQTADTAEPAEDAH